MIVMILRDIIQQASLLLTVNVANNFRDDERYYGLTDDDSLL